MGAVSKKKKKLRSKLAGLQEMNDAGRTIVLKNEQTQTTKYKLDDFLNDE